MRASKELSNHGRIMQQIKSNLMTLPRTEILRRSPNQIVRVRGSIGQTLRMRSRVRLKLVSIFPTHHLMIANICQVYKFEEYLPESLRAWFHQKIDEFRVMLIENGILADNAAPTGTESKAVTDARNAFQAVNDEVGTKVASLKDQKGDLEKDYGPSDVFRALKGTCVFKDSGEYTYELCWMEKTSQKSKKGGGNTGMGNFVRFDTLEVDEEIGAGWQGLG